MSFAEIKEKYEKMKGTVSSSEGFFKNIVEYRHMDGTFCRFHYASIVDFGEGWFAVFTEHNGSFLQNYDDICWVRKIEYEYVFHNRDGA